MTPARTGLIIGVLLLAAACSDGADIASTTTAAVPSSTTTQVPVATTTTTATPTTTQPPITTTTITLNTRPIEGVPDELVTLIGAPLPDVDLTINGPEDVDRWLSEWDRWRIWLSANPTTDPGLLGVGYVPNTEPFRESLELATANPDRRTLSAPWILEFKDGTFDEAFEEGGELLITLTIARAASYVVENNQLVEVLDLIEEPVLVVFRLRRNEDGAWRLESREIP